MSWSDIFYPGNPERRERLIRKNQEVRELMKNNFRATNQLIEVLNKHLCLSFSPITLNEKATVKENCDVIIERIHEIQVEVEKIEQKLKEKLEPTLYEKLKNMSLSADDHHQVSTVVSVVFTATDLVSAAVTVVGWIIKHRSTLTTIRSTCFTIGKGLVGSVVFVMLLEGFDIIISAILGAIERDQLESALEEYDRALEEFRPASEKYQDNITYVRIKIEEYK